MNIKEAIENVRDCVRYAMSEHNYTQEQDAYDEESLTIAVWAMKKQIPMKPLSSYGEYTCPMCEVTVSEGDEYCPNCGQKIDWED